MDVPFCIEELFCSFVFHEKSHLGVELRGQQTWIEFVALTNLTEQFGLTSDSENVKTAVAVLGFENLQILFFLWTSLRTL